MSNPRIGYRMRALAEYVSAVPGCNCAQALRGVGLPDRGRGAYRPLQRAVAAGLIIETGRNPCHLFRCEVDRQLWQAWQELRGCADPARAAELAIEIHELRTVQIAAYAMAQEGARQ